MLRWTLTTTLILLLAGANPAASDRGHYLKHLRFLASDELRGRGNSMPELRIAANYIARHFAEYGLEPAGDDGTFFQEFEITTGHRLGLDNRLTLFIDSGPALILQLHRDYTPLTYGGAISGSTDLVFVGFGISASEYGYDDYQAVEVQGKVVVMYDHEPQEQFSKSPFAGRQLTPYSTITTKVMTAKHRGAAAVIIVPDSFNHSDAASEPLPSSEMEELGIQAVLLSAEWGDNIIGLSGRKASEIRNQIDTHMQPASFVFDQVRGEIRLDAEKVRHSVQNVVGKIPGQTSKAIVIGAHYDHLGLGGKNSLAPASVGQVHNGADDNASGTAGLLQLARELAGSQPRYNLLLVGFAGEEMGLLGSSHYVEGPLIPLEDTIAMLNMDMIGRSTGQLMIGGVGTAKEFKGILDELAVDSPLEFKLAETPRGSSDHTSFSVKQVPILFFFSGLHGDYHKPSDDWNKIEITRSYQILDVVRGVVNRLDQLADPPQFVDLGGADPHARPVTGRGGGYGPSFGSIPDMGYEEGGVRFAEIRSGTPAHKAGIKGGDILVEFDGKTIDNLYDFTYALRARSPGDEIKVVVRRGARTLVFQVVLEARR